MDNYPLISILVFVYNNQRYLYENLRSVFEQSYPNIELLVNDDGSDDFDIDAISAWISNNKTDNIKNVVLNRNDVNLGSVKSVETLQKLSHGEWLFNIAADDTFYDNNVISALYNSATQYNHAEVITAQTLMYDNSLKKVLYPAMSKEDIAFLKKSTIQEILNRTIESCWLPAAYLYKRTVLPLIGIISDDYRIIEDIVTQIRLIRQGIRPYFCDITSTIKHRDGGISHGAIGIPTLVQLYYKQDCVTFYEKEVIPYRDIFAEESIKKAMQVYSYAAYDSIESHINYMLPNNKKQLCRDIDNITYLIKFSRKKMVITYFVAAFLLFCIGLLSVGFDMSIFTVSIKLIPFAFSFLVIIVCICAVIVNIYYRIKQK